MLRKQVVTLAAIFSFLVSFGQVPNYGVDTLLDVGCWNMEWFGSTGFGPTNENLQFQNAKKVLSGVNMDIWGVTEMSNMVTYNELLGELPQYGGAIASYSQTQKTAVFYKKDLFELVSSEHILTSSNFSFAFASRPPLEVVLKTKAPLAADTIYVIVIHLKAYADEESYLRRKEAIYLLKEGYLDEERTNKKTIILGDWNDDVDVSTVSGMESPFLNLVEDSENYFFTTKQLSDQGLSSYPSYAGSFIDHICVTAPLKNEFISTSARVLTTMPSYISGYLSNTSDHLPVLSSFRWKSSSTLSIEDANDENIGFHWSFSENEVKVVGNWQGTVTIYNLEGQEVALLQKVDDAMITYDISNLPKGMYFAQIQKGNRVIAERFIR